MRRFLRMFVPLGLAACLCTISQRAASAAVGSAMVNWTAPGGDSLTGQASGYDLRYSPAPITPSNFLLATRVLGVPAPQPAGTAEQFRVNSLVAGTGYYFAIRSVDQASNWSALSNVAFFVIRTTSVVAPREDQLSAAWPNPARASTSWSFTLAAAGPIEIVVFDLAGRRVRHMGHEWHDAGPGEVTWDLRDDAGGRVGQGVYLVRSSFGRHSSVQKVVILL